MKNFDKNIKIISVVVVVDVHIENICSFYTFFYTFDGNSFIHFFFFLLITKLSVSLSLNKNEKQLQSIEWLLFVWFVINNIWNIMLFGSRFFDFVPTKKKILTKIMKKTDTKQMIQHVSWFFIWLLLFLFFVKFCFWITIYVVLINLYASKIYRLKSSDLKRNSAADYNDRCTNFFWENNKKPMWKNEFIDNQSMFEFVFGQFFCNQFISKNKQLILKRKCIRKQPRNEKKVYIFSPFIKWWWLFGVYVHWLWIDSIFYLPSLDHQLSILWFVCLFVYV